MEDERPQHRAAPAPAGAAEGLQPTGLDEVWRLLAPWLGHGLLAAAAVMGLFTASTAPDAATYDAGMITAALAVLIIAIRLKRQLDGKYVGILLGVSPAREDTLLVSIAVLTLLGLGGAIVAATIGGVFYGIGLALFLASAGLVFVDIKRYFDRRDRRG